MAETTRSEIVSSFLVMSAEGSDDRFRADQNEARCKASRPISLNHCVERNGALRDLASGSQVRRLPDPAGVLAPERTEAEVPPMGDGVESRAHGHHETLSTR